MYDAPLISPENKDSSADTLASLPKVALAAKVAAGHSVSDAVKTVLDKLQADNVIYAELRLSPNDFVDAHDASTSEALLSDVIAQATSALPSHDVDARIILSADTQAANVAEIADAAIAHDEVAGFALVGDNVVAHASCRIISCHLSSTVALTILKLASKPVPLAFPQVLISSMTLAPPSKVFPQAS